MAKTFTRRDLGNLAMPEHINELQEWIEFQSGVIINVKDAPFNAVGNGIADDTAAIASAVAAVPATGGVLFFPAGTYLLGSGNINIFGKTDITFRGVGRSSLIKFGPTPGQTIMVTNIGNPLGNDDIAFESLAFDTNNLASAIILSVTNNARRVRVSGCTFITPKSGGVSIGSAQDVIVTGCSFLGAGDSIITTSASSPERLAIVGNTFDGQTLVGNGVNINSPTGDAKRVTVVGNTIKDYATSGSNGLGIAFSHVVDGTIVGNTVSNCGIDGIHVEDGSIGIAIQGNTVVACGRSGIAVNSSNASRHTRQISVTGNSVTGCLTVSGIGAIALEGSQPLHDCTVHGNVIRNNGRAAAECYGIDLVTSADGHRVIGNTVLNTTGSTTAGIRVAASTDVLVQGNRCSDDQGVKTQQYGIKVQGNQTDASLLDNDLQGNLTGSLDESGIGTKTRYKKRNNNGHVTEASGVTSVADGGTISHGLTTTPTKYGATGSVAGQIVSITAVSSTTLTVAIKTGAGAAGTTQNIAWWAEV